MKQKIISMLFLSIISLSSFGSEKTENINLLNKIGYGVTEKSLSLLENEGRKGWLKQQLFKPNLFDDTEIENAYKYPKTNTEMFQLIKKYDFYYNQIVLQEKPEIKLYDSDDGLVMESLSKRFNYALNSENRLREMMVWFWYNHFNIGVYVNTTSAIYVTDYENKIRQNALGNFKDLLTMTSHHPAMLYYLNNAENMVEKNSNYVNLNENYAREFLELHTMGVNSGYTQQDVQELTKILTGLKLLRIMDYVEEVKNEDITYERLATIAKKECGKKTVLKDYFLYCDNYHYDKDKVFLGHKIKNNHEKELDQVINIVTMHPKTAYFLSKKMAIYFLSDNPSEEIVQKMANAYLENKGDIAKTLEILLLSKEFESSLKEETKAKDSYSFIISTLKVAIMNNPGKNKKITLDTIRFLKYIEGDPYFKNTPEGFSLYGKDWISSARLHEYLYFVSNLLKNHEEFFYKEYPINYKLLSIAANKKIENKEDALIFLTSENWLKK